jgi:hypothetical protein
VSVLSRQLSVRNNITWNELFADYTVRLKTKQGMDYVAASELALLKILS